MKIYKVFEIVYLAPKIWSIGSETIKNSKVLTIVYTEGKKIET